MEGPVPGDTELDEDPDQEIGVPDPLTEGAKDYLTQIEILAAGSLIEKCAERHDGGPNRARSPFENP